MCSEDGWCWDNPLPQGLALNAVWGRHGSEVFAVGAHGIAMRFDGSEWSRDAADSSEDLVGVWGNVDGLTYAVSSAGSVLRFDAGRWVVERRHDERLSGIWGQGRDLYVTGDEGLILHFDGERWKRIPTPTSAGLHALSGSSAWRMFAVGDAGTVLHFDGLKWKSMRPPTSATIDRLWVGPQLLIVSSADGAYVHDGDRWHSSPTGPFVGCWGRANIIRCLASDQTWFLHRADWMVHRAGKIAGEMRGLWSPDGRTAFVVGARGAIYKFSRGYWEEHSQGPTSQTLNAVWGSNPGSVWAVGDSGAIVHSNGSRWRTVADFPTIHAFNDVWGSSDRDVYAVGNAGLMAHFDGRRWSRIEGITDRDLHAVWGRAGNDVYVAGDDAELLHFGGSKWTKQRLAGAQGGSQPLMALNDTCSGDLWIFGRLDRMWRQVDGSWSDIAARPLFDAWISGRGEVFTAGHAIRRFDGHRWTQELLPAQRVDAIHGFEGGEMIAVGAGGSILQRSRLGVWTEQTSGTNRALRDVWGQDPSELFVVGEGGTILRRRLAPDGRLRHADLASPDSSRVSSATTEP